MEFSNPKSIALRDLNITIIHLFLTCSAVHVPELFSSQSSNIEQEERQCNSHSAHKDDLEKHSTFHPLEKEYFQI